MSRRAISPVDKDQAQRNADDFLEILDDILEDTEVPIDRRSTLHLPPRGTFSKILEDAESKINADQPRGRFGAKRHQRHTTEKKNA